jgi:hypothetical protein
MTFNLYEAMGQATVERPPPRRSVDDIVSAGRSLRRRQRRVKAAACGAAAVLAVVAGVALVVPNSGPAEPTAALPPARSAAGSSPAWPDLDQPFQFSFKGYDLGALHVSDPMLATPGYQQSAVYLDGVTQGVDDEVYPSPVATLAVFRPGVFNPSRYQAGRKIQVGGVTGLAISNAFTVGEGRTVIGPSGTASRSSTTRTVQRPAIAWQYADNAWATLVAHPRLPDKQTAESLFALAAGLRPAAVSTP